MHKYQPGSWMFFGSTPLSCDICGMNEEHKNHRLEVEVSIEEYNDFKDLDDMERDDYQ